MSSLPQVRMPRRQRPGTAWRHTFAIIVLLLLLLLLLLMAGGPPTSDAAVRPVLTTSRALEELSFDGSRLAWVQPGPHPFCASDSAFAVHRYSFVTRRATRLIRPRCINSSTGYFGRLVLAGARTYWAQSQGGNSSRTWSIWTAVAPGQSTKLIERAVDCGAACSCSPPSLGTDLGPTEGAATTFLFSNQDMAPSPSCSPGGDEGIVTASRITRVIAGPSGLVMEDVPGAPGASIVGRPTLAYAAGRVAIVPLENGQPPNHEAGRVEIRDVGTGALVSQFSPAGSIRAVTLARSLAAVLVRGTNGKSRIERYSIATGALASSSPVRSGVFPSLDIHGPRIVYRVGPEIRLLRVDTGRSRLLHRVSGTSSFTIGDVQIEGNRVVWYVRSEGRTRIFDLILP
jgi:hypothetical protein